MGHIINSVFGRMVVPFFACVTGYYLTEYSVEKPKMWLKNLKSLFKYAIYLATEERKIRDAFEKAFPDKILENKRVYYDDIYDQDDSISYIKDVHFERKNDNYLSGLEYLSSIILLSRCTALVGGNCGGTLQFLHCAVL